MQVLDDGKDPVGQEGDENRGDGHWQERSGGRWKRSSNGWGNKMG